MGCTLDSQEFFRMRLLLLLLQKGSIDRLALLFVGEGKVLAQEKVALLIGNHTGSSQEAVLVV
jgi:hypothetical protein